MGKKILGLLAVALLGVSGSANAALVTRQFEIQSTSGALQFGPTVGSFTYNDSIAPAGGGLVSQVGLLSDLSISFGGMSFDETTANTGWLRFDTTGGLLEATFGNNCFAGGCQLTSGMSYWWVRVGVPGTPSYNVVNDFGYSGYNGESEIRYTYLNRLLPQSVPEPGTLALLGLGLAGLGLSRRRTAN